MKRPNYYASVWVAGKDLYAELPAIGKLTAHSVKFPLNEKGIMAFVLCLRSRSETSVLGTKGDPTQHLVDKIMNAKPKPKAKPKVYVSPDRQAKANEVLRNLGMIK